MTKVERILAGIDLGPDTERVLAYASFFSKLWNATIDLLYVIDYLVTPPAYMMPYLEEEKESALRSMRRWQELLYNLGINAKSEVLLGRLYESFDFSLKNLNADLLILGYRTHPMRRSSSEKLIKGLDIPMLVVKGQKSEDARLGEVTIKRILCPVDFSEHSRKALVFASNLSAITDSSLDIIHVLPVHLLKEKGEKGLVAVEEMTKEAKEMMKRLLEELSISFADVTILSGEPHKGIISFALDKDTDLIIIGARGLGMIKGILLGSVSEAVLRSSPCPVMIVR
ncbi:MAG: universal stress protein [Thermodesulfovibrionales bacterium]